MLVSEMLSEVRDHGFDDLTDTRILGFINDTYWDICSREPWPFLEASASVAVDGTGKITSPTDIDKILAISTTSPNGPNLIPMRTDEFTRTYGTNLTLAGTPQLYFSEGDDFFVYPIPASASLTVRYIRIPAALTVSPDSSPILPIQHHRAVVLGTLVKCYTLEDDPEQAGVFTNMYEQRLIQMRNSLWMRQYDRTDTIQDLDTDEVDYWINGAF